MVFVPNNHFGVRAPKAVLDICAPFFQTAGTLTLVTPEHLHSTIVYSPTELKGVQPNESAQYSARITGAELWFDVYLRKTDLILTLESEDLTRRRQELLEHTRIQPIYGDNYKPHVTISYNVTNQKRRNKGIINSFIDAILSNYKNWEFKLSGEYLEGSSGFITTTEAPE
jgi:2'-5' RNA ligase